jgi:hypothetical protein
MKSVKGRLVKWYFITVGAALALAPTMVALAGGASNSD